jgi:hypothetical protein
MGLMICRWINSGYDGIYWLGDSTPPKDSYSLFDVMERYLTKGETVEILSYDPRDRKATGLDESPDMVALRNERIAHGDMED